MRIRILEGAPRLLAPLAENVSAAATRLLGERHVQVNTSCRVVRVDWNQVSDAQGNVYPADLCVWAAGIKAPPLLAQVGLPVTKGGQVKVDGQLRVEGVPGVFAFGDCAFCPQPDGKSVPPRAQSAHQQADYLYALLQLPAGTDLGTRPPYLFHDHGSLVSIGSSATVGSLMGNLFRIDDVVRGGPVRAHGLRQPAPDAPPRGDGDRCAPRCSRWRASWSSARVRWSSCTEPPAACIGIDAMPHTAATLGPEDGRPCRHALPPPRRDP